MRVSLCLSQHEYELREVFVREEPDKIADYNRGERSLAAQIYGLGHSLGHNIEGVDLCMPNGEILYTLVGDPIEAE